MQVDSRLKFQNKDAANMTAIKSLGFGFIIYLHIYINISSWIHRLMRPGDIKITK